MGATLSYLGYRSYHQPFPHSHEHVSQQLYQGRGPTLIFRTGDSASRSIIDLCARLATLEKDLQISQAGNANKDAVIQYLLQSSVSNARVNEDTISLKEQLLFLKTTIGRMDKDNEEIKDRLQKAEDVIFAVATPSNSNSRPQSASTSFSSCSDFPAKSGVVTDDLIDLLGCSHESEIAKCKEEETTLLDEDYEDDLETEGEFNNTTPDQSLHLSFDTEFEGPSYITHFADSDEDAKPQNAVEVSGEVMHQGACVIQIADRIFDRSSWCLVPHQNLSHLHSSSTTFPWYPKSLMNLSREFYALRVAGTQQQYPSILRVVDHHRSTTWTIGFSMRFPRS